MKKISLGNLPGLFMFIVHQEEGKKLTKVLLRIKRKDFGDFHSEDVKASSI